MIRLVSPVASEGPTGAPANVLATLLLYLKLYAPYKTYGAYNGCIGVHHINKYAPPANQRHGPSTKWTHPTGLSIVLQWSVFDPSGQ